MSAGTVPAGAGMKTCRIDGGELLPIMDLGAPFVSDFVEKRADGMGFPLRLGLGKTSGLLQLFESYPADKMYRRYWYLSGINESMRAALRNIVESTRRWVHVGPGDIALDIGCNDGTLLSCWPADVVRLGIDPAENLAELARAQATATATDFFSEKAFRSLEPRRRAKVITSIAMFYDLDDPHAFVEDIKACLEPDGLWVLEMAYAPLMLRQNAFDCICHEHLSYYTLAVLDRLVAQHEMRVVDVTLNHVNGGSFRAFVTHRDARLPATVSDADIGQYRRQSYLEMERLMELVTPAPYEAFRQRIETERRRTMEFLTRCRENRQTVVGYGASTKGNTLLQCYGVTEDLLPAIADRSPVKHGRFTAGSGIPIISEDEMRAMKPDFLLALPWHFLPAFLNRERDLLDRGTRFVVPLPEFQVIGA